MEGSQMKRKGWRIRTWKGQISRDHDNFTDRQNTKKGQKKPSKTAQNSYL